MPKYVVRLESGRDFIMESDNFEDAAWDAREEAAYMDDYLIDLEPINEQEEETQATLLSEQLAGNS